MRALAIALLFALSGACYAPPAVDRNADAGPGSDALVAADAYAPASDAYVRPDDAFVPPADAPAGTRFGYVQFLQDGPGAIGEVYLIASFTAAPPSHFDLGIAGDGCTILEQLGPCAAVACTGAGVISDSAGTVSGSTAGGFAISATMPSPYYFSSLTPMHIAGGEIVTLAALGDAVPAFSGRVSMPSEPSVGFPGVVSRSANVVVSWSPIDAEQTTVTIQDTADPAGAYRVECVTAASTGSVTVPPSMIARFATGTAVITSVGVYNTSTVTAGDYGVTLFVQWSLGRIANVSP
jgi:hypothetical protein